MVLEIIDSIQDVSVCLLSRSRVSQAGKSIGLAIMLSASSIKASSSVISVHSSLLVLLSCLVGLVKSNTICEPADVFVTV